MEWLKSFVSGFFENIWKGFLWLAEAIGQVVSWLLYTIYDGLLTVIFLFADTVDLSEVAFNMAAQYSGLPEQVIWFVNQVDLPQSLTYVAGAITIRMILNIIPAAVTRV